MVSAARLATPLRCPQPSPDTPARRDAVTILAEWRSAERQLAATGAGTPDEEQAQAEVDRLREEYRRITAPTRERDR